MQGLHLQTGAWVVAEDVDESKFSARLNETSIRFTQRFVN